MLSIPSEFFNNKLIDLWFHLLKLCPNHCLWNQPIQLYVQCLLLSALSFVAYKQILSELYMFVYSLWTWTAWIQADDWQKQERPSCIIESSLHGFKDLNILIEIYSREHWLFLSIDYCVTLHIGYLFYLTYICILVINE